jgi:hypothetical protein
MILGGAKQHEIGQVPILQWYMQQLEAFLVQSDARLMVIGYGFRDEHINTVIERAASRGLKLFVIDPRGARIAYEMNELRKGNHIGASDTQLEQLMKHSLIGGSSRALRAVFSDDEPEHSKIMRFFSRP